MTAIIFTYLLLLLEVFLLLKISMNWYINKII
jgi:hypothetical protein